MTLKQADPSIFVLFGGTGDLARRKLLPSIARLALADQLGSRFHILGVARQGLDDEGYRTLARDSLAKAGIPKEGIARLCDTQIHFQSIGAGKAEDFRALGARLEALQKKFDLPPNRAFYLSLPPRVFSSTVDGLGDAGLNRSEGWTRVVLEKPFGTDLKSAGELNRIVHARYDEEQIYRIDHYLGKDTVQNLLVFRFANVFFESLWNRDRVDSVQITVGESLGVGTRAGYYDHSGALRDMVQNHITQLLTLIAMEAPSAFDADAIRYEKIKVLRCMAPICLSDVVRGQYTAGEINGENLKGYLEEEGVAKDSQTETFVALKLGIDNWRWHGVPFYIRTGKCMPKKTTQIAVRFRGAPVSLFRAMGGESMDTTDVLLITLQPDEGFSIHLDIKAPGQPFKLQRIPLHFRYKELFSEMTDGYQTLLHDVLTGDQTLFVHADEVRESWRLYTPLIENPPPVVSYPAGTWGPKEADHLAIPERELWTE